MPSAIAVLETQWATISYHMPKEAREAAFQALSQQAEVVARQFPGQALPLAWRGVILCSWAEAQGGLQALDHVTAARDVFLQAKKIDAHVMSGTVDGYLGTLYHAVPAWPIGFGDKAKAAAYFRQALADSPASIDINFLYGHYLFETGDYAQAKQYLTAALAMPVRPDHVDYDNGRRQDITETLARMK
ncbi:MAG TPA: tetratricopeptide repeat protein [Dongiaceae bacterium]|nr:tetratricopeptide repeat protein [Dongiaceae bacterium]